MHTAKAIAVIVVVVFMTSVSCADEWDDAEKRIQRVDPSAFHELPRNMVEELQRRGCKIPQSYGAAKPHNVIKASFAAKGQDDWAVLCSRDGSSEIQIFWGGPVRCTSGLRKSQDRAWLQGMGREGIVYSQTIESVGRTQILSYHEAFGGRKPPPIDHHGIDHAFLGKASVVYYCYEGTWLELTGAD